MSDNENQLTDFLAGLSEERRFALKDFFLDKHFDDARAVELLQELYVSSAVLEPKTARRRRRQVVR